MSDLNLFYIGISVLFITCKYTKYLRGMEQLASGLFDIWTQMFLKRKIHYLCRQKKNKEQIL